MNIGSHGGGCGHACCLKVQNLNITLGNNNILKDINLHIHCGEMVALIGPNGAGKSTLIKAILGQIEYSGSISFATPGSRSRKPLIGYVPQSPVFDAGDPITIADLFVCCMSKRPAFLGISKSMRSKILDCLQRVNGEELIDKPIGALSGGELQRVLLALALEPLPNILILDEPLSGVDVEGIQTLMSMLDDIRKTYDLSILMITHDFTILEPYADQVILLNKSILRQGPPKDVLLSDAFKNTFHYQGGAEE